MLITIHTAPIREHIHYEPTFFAMTETSKDYGLVGQPSEELDKNWSNIMQYFYAEIPKEYMQKLGREKEGIRLPNGNYLANYAFIHQLHCLVGGIIRECFEQPHSNTISRNASIKLSSQTTTGQI